MVMNSIPRLYTDILRQHLGEERQMAFLSGPRQVGKTTVAEGLASHYLNWDNSEHRLLILRGEKAVAEMAGTHFAMRGNPVLVFACLSGCGCNAIHQAGCDPCQHLFKPVTVNKSIQ